VRHRTPHLRIDLRLTLHGVEWPLFDLRLSVGDVALRPVTDADLPAIAAMYDDDDEQDPRWEHFAGLSAQRNRHRLLVQRTWHHRGSWSPSSWCLDLAVEVSGEPVGLQALEADDFAKLRTVDSGSWLAVQARGHGTAVAMRTAILGLAFDHLGAVAAISSARVDNAPSLAVSRRLGYVENGVSLTESPTGVVELQHLRLTRESWAAHPVEVTGLDACLAWFGVSD
jgi:RimJ/RimL family protein N-acetyltransferase